MRRGLKLLGTFDAVDHEGFKAGVGRLFYSQAGLLMGQLLQEIPGMIPAAEIFPGSFDNVMTIELNFLMN